jgi:rubrerythrin
VAGSQADLPALRAALEIERALIALYAAGLRVVRGREAMVARRVLAQEHAHATTIAELIRELGGTPAPPKPAAVYERGLPARGGVPAFLTHAMLAEESAVAAYAGAIPKLANARLRGTFGAIMTSEAEHAAALGVSK